MPAEQQFSNPWWRLVLAALWMELLPALDVVSVGGRDAGLDGC